MQVTTAANVFTFPLSPRLPTARPAAAAGWLINRDETTRARGLRGAPRGTAGHDRGQRKQHESPAPPTTSPARGETGQQNACIVPIKSKLSYLVQFRQQHN